MKEQWKHDLRTRLQKHEVPAPELSWNEIGEKAGWNKAPKRRTRRLFYFSAAACALLLTGFFVVTQLLQKEKNLLLTDLSMKTNKPRQQVQAAAPSVQDAGRLQGGEGNSDVFVGSKQKGTVQQHADNVSRNVQPALKTAETTVSEANKTAPETTLYAEAQQVLTPEKPVEKSAVNTVSQTASSPVILENGAGENRTGELFDKRTLKEEPLLAVSVYASGSMSVADGGSNNRMEMALESRFSDPLTSVGLESGGYKPMLEVPIKKVKHQQPLRLGMQVQWNLTPQWGLATGLSYDRLVSETTFTGSESSVRQVQKLHFAGIPLQAVYTFYRTKHFRTYVLVGGRVAFPVGATLSTESNALLPGVSKHTENLHLTRPQWSVEAAVGTQWLPFRKVGIYIQPGVVRQFNNHSGIETYYTAHPLGFNIDLGLHWQLGK